MTVLITMYLQLRDVRNSRTVYTTVWVLQYLQRVVWRNLHDRRHYDDSLKYSSSSASASSTSTSSSLANTSEPTFNLGRDAFALLCNRAQCFFLHTFFKHVHLLYNPVNYSVRGIYETTSSLTVLARLSLWLCLPYCFCLTFAFIIRLINWSAEFLKKRQDTAQVNDIT